MTSVSFPWGQSVIYDYAAANRLIDARQSLFTTYYTYDNLDQSIELKYVGTDTNHTVLADYSNITYDTAGNRTGMQINTVSYPDTQFAYPPTCNLTGGAPGPMTIRTG
jgi:hypothetical protein